MTNEERYKTPETRDSAFRRFCNRHVCNKECRTIYTKELVRGYT